MRPASGIAAGSGEVGAPVGVGAAAGAGVPAGVGTPAPATEADATGVVRQSASMQDASGASRRAPVFMTRSYAPGPTRDAWGAIRPRRLHTNTTAAMPPSAPIINSGACQLQFSRLEKASELFSEWATKHGYSEPL